MTSQTIAAAIVRVSFLPASEWTGEDLELMIRPEEQAAYAADDAKAVELWLIRGRAFAMLAKLLEKIMDREGDGSLVFPTDEEALEFAVSSK